jgi:hypothetical protein
MIPKKTNYSSFADFRPISLCKFCNKIITRVLAEQFAPLMSKLISPNQSGFLRGRNIIDNILLAQEMVHSIDKRTFAGNLILKLDMVKPLIRSLGALCY